MIKDIIEKIENDINEMDKENKELSYMNYQLIVDMLNSYLPALEKSALQEEALIKALVYSMTRDIKRKKYQEFIQLLETHTGKKWNEIKEVYR